MAYAFVTFLQAQANLAARLNDSGQQFWAPGELGSYIIEALRTWNSLTSVQRGEFTLNLVQGNWFYDLSNPAVVPTSLRTFNVTTLDILSQIEYHLLEPLTSSYPLTWNGSNQFVLTDVLGALTRRRDEVLGATGCQVSRQIVEATPGRIVLPDSVIDIRRVAWFSAGFVMTWDSSSPLTWDQSTFTWGSPPGSAGLSSILRPSDDWSESVFDVGFTIAGEAIPRTYRQSSQPPLSFDVDTIPPMSGLYDILTVNSGPVVSTTVPSLLGLPDDWSWIVKFGVLGDLLSRESNAKDELRAKYCQQRFQQGLALLEEAPAVLAVRIANIPSYLDAVSNGDDFNLTWQSQAQGPPQGIYTAGLNQLIFWPGTDGGTYGTVITVVRNAQIPVAGGDFLQVAKDDYDSILDYAQHLAAFKMGGSEFAATVPLFSAFLKRASLYNSKLKELGQFQKPMYEISGLDEQRHPRYNDPGVLSA